MIFYFTGTGNSRWVAEALRKALEEPLVSIVEVLTEEKSEYVYPLGEREKVILYFLFILGDRRYWLLALFPG